MQDVHCKVCVVALQWGSMHQACSSRFDFSSADLIRKLNNRRLLRRQDNAYIKFASIQVFERRSCVSRRGVTMHATGGGTETGTSSEHFCCAGVKRKCWPTCSWQRCCVCTIGVPNCLRRSMDVSKFRHLQFGMLNHSHQMGRVRTLQLVS